MNLTCKLKLQSCWKTFFPYWNSIILSFITTNLSILTQYIESVIIRWIIFFIVSILYFWIFYVKVFCKRQSQQIITAPTSRKSTTHNTGLSEYLIRSTNNNHVQKHTISVTSAEVELEVNPRFSVQSQKDDNFNSHNTDPTRTLNISKSDNFERERAGSDNEDVSTPSIHSIHPNQLSQLLYNRYCIHYRVFYIVNSIFIIIILNTMYTQDIQSLYINLTLLLFYYNEILRQLMISINNTSNNSNYSYNYNYTYNIFNLLFTTHGLSGMTALFCVLNYFTMTIILESNQFIKYLFPQRIFWLPLIMPFFFFWFIILHNVHFTRFLEYNPIIHNLFLQNLKRYLNRTSNSKHTNIELNDTETPHSDEPLQVSLVSQVKDRVSSHYIISNAISFRNNYRFTVQFALQFVLNVVSCIVSILAIIAFDGSNDAGEAVYGIIAFCAACASIVSLYTLLFYHNCLKYANHGCDSCKCSFVCCCCGCCTYVVPYDENQRLVAFLHVAILAYKPEALIYVGAYARDGIEQNVYIGM